MAKGRLFFVLPLPEPHQVLATGVSSAAVIKGRKR